MVAATYATDLATFELAEGTAWAEATAAGWTSVFAITTGETDDYIQGTQCNSTTVKTGVGVLLANFGSGITLNQDDAILIWAKWDVYPSLDTEANGGIRTVVGSSLADFYGFDHLGSDSYIYDGWINLAMGDPADADITPDYTVGTPTTTKQYAGWAFNALSVPSKGNPYKVDAIRYGRCEIYSINGEAAAYGTFENASIENDYNDVTNGYNRWGLFQKKSKDNYLHKGLFSFGQTATACDFRDSNRTIQIADTKHVTPAFNKYEVHNASSNVELTAINISALGSVSRGNWENVDNATVVKNSCTFTDMGTFIYQSNTTVNNGTYRRCDQVTLGGGTLNSPIFDVGITTSLLMASGTLNTGSFKGDETTTPGHAVDLGTRSGVGQTLAWDSTLDNGVTNQSVWEGSTQAPTAGTQGTVNSAITVNVPSGSDLKISVTGSGTIPTVQNTGTGTLEITANEVDITITAIDGETSNPIEGASVYMKLIAGDGGAVVANGETNASGVFTTTYGGATPVSLDTDVSAVRDSSSVKPYVDFTLGGQIDSSGYTQTALMNED